jgi:hypothetical protein
MYFDKFPKIYYDFIVGSNQELKVVTDITRNVRIIKDILSNVTLYDEYDIKEGETPEIIADKFYGSSEYHWVVMLTNERYDYINDFPLPYAELEKHITEVYGSRQVTIESDNPLVVNIENNLFTIPNHGFNTTDIITYSSNGGTNIGGIFNGRRYKVIKVTNDQFKLAENRLNALNNEPIDLTSYGTGTHSLQISNQYKTHHFEDADGNIVNENYINVNGIAEEVYPVSNYEYEERLNESKRRIKLISPTLLPIVLKNFEDLV